jgi:hypothetical protein
MSIGLQSLFSGRDTVLFETRRMVLETNGYLVRAASDLSTVRQTINAHRIDLLILCHSLSMEECNRAMAHPSFATKSLVLMAGDRGCHSQMLSQVFDSTERPARLISTVKALTNPAVGVPS